MLRSPDASEGVDSDPFATPASETSTDYPLLKGGKPYRLAIKTIVIEDVEDDEVPSTPEHPTQVMIVKVMTTKDELDVREEVLHAGFVLTKRIYLYEKGERSIEGIKRDIATLIKAVEGKNAKTTLRDLIDNPTRYDGLPVEAKVGIQIDKKGQYPDQNTIRFSVPA